MRAEPATDREISGFAIDLDGVVWLSRKPIPGSIEALGALRAGGRPLVFVTNDPRSTRAELAAQLTELGAPTETGAVLTSAAATAHRLSEHHPGARVLSVGTESLARELGDCGLHPVGTADPDAEETAAVVVGGGAGFDYEVLRIAADAVRAGAELWATNKDPTYPTARGLVPGTGSIVAAIEVASGTRARNVGKPEPGMFEEALRILGIDAASAGRALMAGDSLHSDIAGAAGAGLRTALVTSGRDARGDIPAAPAKPEFVFDDLAALAAELA